MPCSRLTLASAAGKITRDVLPKLSVPEYKTY